MHFLVTLCRFVCVALLLIGSGSASAQARIALRHFAQVAKHPVTLGDVAELSTQKLPTLLRLMEIPLMPNLRTGGVFRLQRDEIKQIVERRMRDIKTQVSWSGADQVEIASPSHTVDGERILRAARAALEMNLAETTTRFDVRALREPNDIEVPLGEVILRTRQLGDAPHVSKRMQVWVDVYVGNRFERTVPVTFEVNVYASSKSETVIPVLAYTQTNDGRNQCLTSSERRPRSGLRRGDVQITRQESQAPGLSRAVVFHQPASAVVNPQTKPVANALLQPAWSTTTANIPAVTKGGWATLRTQSGLVTLESKVKVMQDGRIGDYVLVRPVHSGSAILAQVSGNEQLEIVDR